MKKRNLAIIVLAAGKGTRMKTEVPKVLNTIHKKPLLEYVLNTAELLDPDKIMVVVGYKSEEVMARFKDRNVNFSIQREQLGTAHAVMQTKGALEGFTGDILILSGDVPLIKKNTLNHLIDSHKQSESPISFITAILDDAKGYGRIKRNEQDPQKKIEAIIEDKDLLECDRSIKEINTGIYCVDKDFLFDNISKIQNLNAQSEYYLTDIIAIAVKENTSINSVCLTNHSEIQGVNTVEQLKALERH